MDYTLDSEQIKRIQDWMDGKSPAPAQELEAYFRLGEAIRRKMLAETTSATARLARAQEKLERIKKADEQAALEGEFDCLGLDTITLAKAVLWSAHKQDLHIESKARFRLLVYAVYCAWLGAREQRLTIEHPIAQTDYGPVLPKMLDEKKVHFQINPGNECYLQICRIDPGLAKTIDNVVRKYMSYELREVAAHFNGKGTPFKKIALECNRLGRKTAEIPDKDIYLWKKSHA